MEPYSHLRHLSRGALELMLGILNQTDPSMLFRIDRDAFLSSISCVIDGKRVQAPEYPLGRGWFGEDVREGKDYGPFLNDSFGVDTPLELGILNPTALSKLYNSDKYSTKYPYGNKELAKATKAWAIHAGKSEESIPLCVVTGSKKNPFGGRLASTPSQRRGM